MGLCRQRTTRLTTKKETASSKSSGVKNLIALIMVRWIKDSLCRDIRKNFAANKFDYWLIIKDVQGVSETTSEVLAEKVDIVSTKKRKRKEKRLSESRRGKLNITKNRIQSFRMCGKTTFSLNGTHTAFVRERGSCCKNVHSVVLSLNDKKGEFYWKTFVAIARPFKIPMAQRTTRLTKNQEIAGSKSFVLEILYCHGISEMDQKDPIHKNYKNFAATHIDYWLVIRDVHGVLEMTSEELAEKVEIFSTIKREGNEASSSENHGGKFNITKKSEYKHLECVAKKAVAEWHTYCVRSYEEILL